ncbi:hypothetical protein [Bradyrhizobium sp.]|uniref:hypothetical protein n=1 Tax=Bradyrhizobium sp. TaxID=376 RepID=UPI0007C8EA85|nr:hypothetical protein [Bradyrhizobium sp.]
MRDVALDGDLDLMVAAFACERAAGEAAVDLPWSTCACTGLPVESSAARTVAASATVSTATVARIATVL